MRDAECGMQGCFALGFTSCQAVRRNGECGMRNAECGMRGCFQAARRHAECGIRLLE